MAAYLIWFVEQNKRFFDFEKKEKTKFSVTYLNVVLRQSVRQVWLLKKDKVNPLQARCGPEGG